MDRLVVRFQLTADAARAALRAGELDVVTHFPPGRAAEIGQEPGVRLLSNQRVPGWDHLELRLGPGGHPALRSKLVRRAIAYGIDRAAIVRRFLRGSDPDARQCDSVLFPDRSPHYEPNWSKYAYRAAESRRLLERAGCRLGADDIYICDGRRFSSAW